MNYETAKNLKEAGFPQVIWRGQEFYDLLGGGYIAEYFMEGESVVDKIKIPNLSELIEACGEKFDNLDKIPTTHHSSKAPILGIEGRQKGGFEASSIEENDDYTWTYGPTPEEAVARLWLALNKK